MMALIWLGLAAATVSVVECWIAHENDLRIAKAKGRPKETKMIHNPGNTRQIDELFAFMSIDAQGNNGIVAHVVGGLGSTPLVTGAADIAEQMKPLAEKVATLTGMPVGLFRFKRDGQIWQSEAGDQS